MKSDPHGETAVLRTGAPLNEAALAVVLLHGRGASAEDILGLGAAFGLDNVAYVAPQAAGHTWYPLSFLAPRQANEPYLSSTLAKVDSIVRSLEQEGFGRERIVIAGFSQGACLTTEYVMRHPAQYAGVIAFTGGLIGPPGSIDLAPEGDMAGTPTLLLSGDPDPHVPWARVEETAAVLSGMGAEVTTRRFPGRPHTITQGELELARGLIVKGMEARAAKTLTLG